MGGTIQKGIVLAFGLATITSLILPGRQTVPVLGTIFGGFRGILATGMGTGKAV
jgi:hypothetical protein